MNPNKRTPAFKALRREAREAIIDFADAKVDFDLTILRLAAVGEVMALVLRG